MNIFNNTKPAKQEHRVRSEEPKSVVEILG